MLQNGTIMPPKKHYYAGIMLDAPHIVLCSKLCWQNVSTPIKGQWRIQTFSQGGDPLDYES